MQAFPPTIGVVLAGGKALRLRSVDKALLPVRASTMLERVIARLKPQCAELLLNANGDPDRFAFTGLPVLPDALPGYVGPLAGICSAL